MGEERALQTVPGAAARDERLMERLLEATAALAHTLGAETLDPIAKATVNQAQRLV